MTEMSAALAGMLSGLPWALGIAAAAWLLMRIMPRMNGATRHAIWWLVLLIVAILPLGLGIHDASRARVQPAWPARITSSFVPAPIRRGFNSPAPVPSPMRPYRPVPVALSAQPRAPFQLRAGGWSALVVVLWMLAFAIQLGRLAWCYVRLRGMKNRSQMAPAELQQRFRGWISTCAIRRDVRLLVSGDVDSPVSAGFLHPAVIVPSRLLGVFGQAELDHVLLHELSHLARLDDWTNLMGRLTFAALWFHPAAVWSLRRIEQEREIACDEWVVTVTGEARPYANSLARLFEFCLGRRREVLAAGMATHGSQLGGRIENLVRRRGLPSRGVSILRVVACSAALVLLVAAAVRAPRWVVLAQARPTYISTNTGTPGRVIHKQGSDAHSFLAAVVEAGYGDLSVDEIISLRNAGVSGEYLMGLSRADWGKLKPQEIIQLHNAGVTPGFLRAVGAAKVPGISVGGAIDLNAHGVSAVYLEKVQSAGMGAFSKDAIISLHNSNVKPELIGALKDAGFTHLETRELIDANNVGLQSGDLRAAHHYGSNLTLKQILKLKQAGVLQDE